MRWKFKRGSAQLKMRLREVVGLLATEEGARDFLRQRGCLRRGAVCGRTGCGRAMTEVKDATYKNDGVVWRCPSHKGSKKSVRSGSFWETSNLPLLAQCEAPVQEHVRDVRGPRRRLPGRIRVAAAPRDDRRRSIQQPVRPPIPVVPSPMITISFPFTTSYHLPFAQHQQTRSPLNKTAWDLWRFFLYMRDLDFVI